MKVRTFGRLSAQLAVAVLLFSFSRAASAAPASWIGGGTDNFWNNGTNWLTGVPPQTGVDSLIFGGANTSNQNNFSGATFTGITFDAGASGFTLNGSSLHLGIQTMGTGITHSGDIVNNSANAQTISLPITLDPGKHIITTASGGLNLSGTITRSTGSTVIFNPGAGAINVAGSGLTTSNGILGGWATIGGDWATLDGSSNVVPYTGYTDVFPSGAIVSDPASNVRIPVGGGNAATAISIAPGTTSINSLLFSGSNATQQINIGAGNKLVLGQDGGIYNATGYYGSAVANNSLRTLTIGASVAQGGTITAGDGLHPATITLSGAPVGNAAGAYTINSTIADNGASGPVSLVVMGGYVTFGGAVTNSYTGGTYIVQGRYSQATAAQLGQGPVYIFPGGEVNTTSQFPTTNFFIAGNGTTEQQGLGALRLFGAGATGATFGGTITLMDNASISPTNASDTRIAGRITGTGSLTISGTNGSQGGGTLNLGMTDGTASLANNYTGDTIIAGHTGGTAATVVTVLKIATNTAAGLNDNIMPHGATGSFSGGPTGNLILNAFTPSSGTNHSATFDLNGSTQTINGLSSIGVAAGNNFVTSSTAGGVLILGDNNATASYAGIVQDGAGTLAVAKIGSGRQTFSGTNTYSGETNINAGAISITGALLSTINGGASNGAVNVNASASSAGALYGAGNGSTTGILGNVTLQAAVGLNKAIINPGATGPGSAGTLTMSSLNVGAGSDLQFDVYGAGNADQIHVIGALTLNGSSTINPSATSAGTYTLIQADGGITGSPTIGSGDTRLNYTPTVAANSISVIASGSVSGLTWTGGLNGNAWDLKSTLNWTNNTLAVQDKFFQGDNVTFGNNANTNVSVVGTVAPGSTTFTNTSGNYVLSGGSIGGPGSLSASGSGAVTLAANNTYSGGTTLSTGTLNINSNGALGLPNSTVTGLTIAGGALGNTSGKSITMTSNPTQTWNSDVVFNGPFDLDLGTGAVTSTVSSGTDRTITVNGGTLTVGGMITDTLGTNGLKKAAQEH